MNFQNVTEVLRGKPKEHEYKNYGDSKHDGLIINQNQIKYRKNEV